MKMSCIEPNQVYLIKTVQWFLINRTHGKEGFLASTSKRFDPTDAKSIFIGTQITMETEDNAVDLSKYSHQGELIVMTFVIDLRLPIDLPQISPPIHTHTLKISHRLKVLVKFRDETREKNMSLSFPLTVVTVPSMLTNNRSVSVTHAQIEIDPWSHEQTHDLPSYFQVIREGMPPSPFVEDN